VPGEDATRLDALAASIPALGRTGILRAIIRFGLDAFEAACAEKDETKRLAGLARLAGLGGAKGR
jgi:hypothetical protein